MTTNKSHPAFSIKADYKNIEIIFYEKEINFKDLFQKLRKEYKVEKLTIQSGGTLNTTLVRDGLIDRVLLVVSPALIGGKDTSTLLDGESLHTEQELFKIKTMKLIQAKPLENNYLLLEYRLN